MAKTWYLSLSLLLLTQSLPVQSQSPAAQLADYQQKINNVSQDLKSFSHPCADTFLNIDTSTAPELSAASCEIIQQGQTDLLDWMLLSCEIMLSNQIPRAEQLTSFYIAQALQQEQIRLEELLKHCSRYLKLIEESDEQLQTFTEWYPIGGWEERFGQTGFYHKVLAIEKQTDLLQARYHYYHFLWQTNANPEHQHPNDSLHQALKLLDVPDTNPGEALEAPWRIWRLKLRLLLARYEPKQLEHIWPMMETLLDQPLSAEQLWSLRRAALEHTLLVSKNDPDKIQSQIEKSIAWLNTNRETVKHWDQKRLELALFAGGLARQRFLSDHQSTDEKAVQHFLDRQLAPLKQLAHEQPEMKPLIEALVARQVEPWFASQRRRNFDAFELLALKRQYQTDDPVDTEKLLQVCDTFLDTMPPTEPAYPRLLYETALLHYQNEQQREACRLWHRLAQDFPTWSHSIDISSARAAALAANLAYNLFVSDPQHYGSMARKVLATLVGQPDSQTQQRQGAFADTAPAKSFRYHYGLVLISEQAYTQAAQILQTVPHDDPHYTQALFQAAQSIARLYPPEANNEQRDRFILALTRLVQKVAPENTDTFSLQIVLMLAKVYSAGSPDDHKTSLALLDTFQPTKLEQAIDQSIYRQMILLRSETLEKLGKTSSALAALHNYLQTYPADPIIATTALQLIQALHLELLKLHAQGDYEAIVSSLDTILPVTATCYKQAQNEQKSVIGRYYLEQSALWLIGIESGAAPNTTIDAEQQKAKAQTLVNMFSQQAETNRQLWFVRCRALLAFAQSDFETSQKLWYQVRQSSSPGAALYDGEAETSAYHWWEARYFGLDCLGRQGQSEEMQRIISTVLQTYAGADHDWKKRLEKLLDLP